MWFKLFCLMVILRDNGDEIDSLEAELGFLESIPLTRIVNSSYLLETRINLEDAKERYQKLISDPNSQIDSTRFWVSIFYPHKA